MAVSRGPSLGSGTSCTDRPHIAALASSSNHGKLVTIVRRVDGVLEVLPLEQTTEFFAALEGPVGQKALAVQVR